MQMQLRLTAVGVVRLALLALLACPRRPVERVHVHLTGRDMRRGNIVSLMVGEGRGCSANLHEHLRLLFNGVDRSLLRRRLAVPLQSLQPGLPDRPPVLQVFEHLRRVEAGLGCGGGRRRDCRVEDLLRPTNLNPELLAISVALRKAANGASE